MNFEIPTGNGLKTEQEYYYPDIGPPNNNYPNSNYPNTGSNLYGQYVDVLKIDECYVENIMRNVIGSGSEKPSFDSMRINQIDPMHAHVISINGNANFIGDVDINGKLVVSNINYGKKLERIGESDSSVSVTRKVNALIDTMNELITGIREVEEPTEVKTTEEDLGIQKQEVTVNLSQTLMDAINSELQNSLKESSEYDNLIKKI